MTKYQVTIQAESLVELIEALRGAAATFAAQAGAMGFVAPGHPLNAEQHHIAPAPQALPFDKPASVPIVALGGNGPICPEHNAVMRPKAAGTNRQGTPYAAGFRCPAAGCRSFQPFEAAS